MMDAADPQWLAYGHASSTRLDTHTGFHLYLFPSPPELTASAVRPELSLGQRHL